MANWIRVRFLSDGSKLVCINSQRAGVRINTSGWVKPALKVSNGNYKIENVKNGMGTYYFFQMSWKINTRSIAKYRMVGMTIVDHTYQSAEAESLTKALAVFATALAK
jgi:hypothetical protein